MLNLLSWKLITLIVLVIAIIIFLFIENFTQTTRIDSIRLVVFFTPIVLGFCASQVIWRKIWKIPLLGKLLSKVVFPDLNGEWEVTLSSNWPILEKTLNAAKCTNTTFAPTTENNLPDMRNICLKSKIIQGWLNCNLEVFPHDNTILQNSHTISFGLLSSAHEKPKRISYVYVQSNRTDIELTDEDNFLGAAVLDVKDDTTLKGHYWTNRGWRKGLGSAGSIEMKRLPS